MTESHDRTEGARRSDVAGPSPSLVPAPASRRASCIPADADAAAGPAATARPKPRLLAQVRQRLRMRHYSPRTEKAYVGWIRRYIHFHGMRHPRGLDADDVREFVSSLAVQGKVSAATQNQAIAAVTFLYRDVLGAPLGSVGEVTCAKRPKRLPVVLTRSEVELVFGELQGVPLLVAVLLYGSGLRLMEAVTLRVKDLDFERRSVLVRAERAGRTASP